MKLTWKSKTLLEVRWPWMSRRKHEQIIAELEMQKKFLRQVYYDSVKLNEQTVTRKHNYCKPL